MRHIMDLKKSFLPVALLSSEEKGCFRGAAGGIHTSNDENLDWAPWQLHIDLRCRASVN